MKLLAVDVGNSRINCGVFADHLLQHTWAFAADLASTPDDYAVRLVSALDSVGLQRRDIGGSVLSSVVPNLTPVLAQTLESSLSSPPLVITVDLPLPLAIGTANPREVGTDRLVNAVAAMERYRPPLLVVDFGTATTFTVVEGGTVTGGAIAPGFKVAADALMSRTAKLPAVPFIRPAKAIGRDTVSSLQSGLLIGYTGLVNEIVNSIEQELGQQVTVVATGGLASLLAPSCRKIHEVRPHLTLEGLELLYRQRLLRSADVHGAGPP